LPNIRPAGYPAKSVSGASLIVTYVMVPDRSSFAFFNNSESTLPYVSRKIFLIQNRCTVQWQSTVNFVLLPHHGVSVP
jgi:hypothetical protein